jgi:hypothetical protein
MEGDAARECVPLQIEFRREGFAAQCLEKPYRLLTLGYATDLALCGMIAITATN